MGDDDWWLAADITTLDLEVAAWLALCDAEAGR